MIVVCEKCSTRFRLDESKVPAEGVKVRCSRCRHRFLVRSEAAPGAPAPARGGGVQDTSPPRRDEDPDLENPEFIHDSATMRSGKGSSGPKMSEPATAESEGAAALSVREEANLFGHDGSAEEPPARADVDFGDGLDAFQPETGGLELADSGEPELDFESVRGAPQHETASIPEDREPPPEFAPAPEPPAPEVAVMTETASPDPAEREKTGSDVEVPGTRLGPRRSAPRAPAVGTPLVLQLAAVVVGLALTAGALRTLAFAGMGLRETSVPAVIHGDDWTAGDLETFHVRDLTGRRFLVVRGRLRSEGRRGRPKVVASLLTAEGRPLGGEVAALPRWVEDEALQPAGVGDLLGTHGAGDRRSAEAWQGEGFTLLFPDPAADARRIAVHLRPPGGAS